MKDEVTGQEFRFDYDDWLRGNQDGVPAQVELPAIRPDVAPLECKRENYIFLSFTILLL